MSDPCSVQCITVLTRLHCIFCSSDVYIITITRKDDGAKCQLDMRPFVQLRNVSGADSKLGLTMS